MGQLLLGSLALAGALYVAGGLAVWQCVLLTVLAAGVYRYLKGSAPLAMPLPENNPAWLTGNSYVAGVSTTDNIKNFYTEMKHHKMSWYWQFATPTLMVTDLELIKQVQITAFEHFKDGKFIPDDYLATMGLQLGLVDARGEQWKELKKLLTPAFSGPRIRKTAEAMNRVGDLMVQHLARQGEQEDQVNVEDAMEKFSMTCIAEVVFGVDVNCFEDPDNAFFEKGKTLMQMWRFLMVMFTPTLMKWLRIPVFNPKSVKHFQAMCASIVEQRKNSKVEKKDILDNLIRASETSPLMTPDMMFTSMTQFFSDGYEGVSRISSVVIYLLALHSEVQEKLFEEVVEVVGEKENVSQEDTTNLPYLDQVINEATRMNPVVFTGRECNKDFRVPGTDLTIPQGTKIMIPIPGLHYDPDIWGDPEVFRPERFSPENRGDIPAGAFQPFGMGPRQCIGLNIIKMEMKIMICHLVRNFRLNPLGSMSLPLVFHPTEPFSLKDKVSVDFVSRKRDG